MMSVLRMIGERCYAAFMVMSRNTSSSLPRSTRSAATGQPAVRTRSVTSAMIARARRELAGSIVDQHLAAGDDDGPAAHRIDLFENMRRDHDRLFRRQYA